MQKFIIPLMLLVTLCFSARQLETDYMSAESFVPLGETYESLPNNIIRVDDTYYFYGRKTEKEIQFGGSLNSGFYKTKTGHENSIFYISSGVSTRGYCGDFEIYSNSYFRCFDTTNPAGYKYNGNGRWVDYKKIVEFIDVAVYKCEAGENFNINTRSCSPACEGNKKFDIYTGVCYNDCTDTNKNKWGFTDNSCIDCSNFTNDLDVLKCYCKGAGSSFTPANHTTPLDDGSACDNCFSFISALDGSGRFEAECDNGSSFFFKPIGSADSTPAKPEIIDNPDKGESTPTTDDNANPDSSSSNNPLPDNSSTPTPTTPTTPTNPTTTPPNTSVETPTNTNTNTNPNTTTTTDNNTSANPKANDGKGKDPKDTPASSPTDTPAGSPNGSPAGGSSTTIVNHHHNGGGSSNSEGDDDISVGEIDYSDVNGLNDSFLNDYTSSITDISSKFDEFIRGLDQFKANIEGRGITSFERSGFVKSCPISKSIKVGSTIQILEFDICKFVSPAKELLYHFFYIVFFLLFLLMTIKIFLFVV